MSKNPAESPIVMVFGILEDNPGAFLSAREIFSEIYEKHQCSMDPDTIKSAIARLIALGKPIDSEIQRLGAKQLPTQVFKLIKTI